MVKKIKNRQKQNLKKSQKQKKRQERIKKQALSKQVSPQLNVEDRVDYALELVGNGNWNEAITKFNDTIGINPNNPQPYGNLGICYASIGKIQLALESFDRSIELDPNYEPALLNRKIVKSLGEGDCLGKKVKTIEYYKEYSLENRSYIQEFAKEQGLLPEKTQIESSGQVIY